MEGWYMGNPPEKQLHNISADERVTLYRKCITEKTAIQQKQITESLLQLMQVKPFPEITVTQLCRHAGVSRRMFYYLFSNMSGALYALIDRKILEVEMGGKNQIAEFFKYWKEQKILLDTLEQNGMSGLLLERMIDRVLREDYDVHNWLQNHGWKNHNRDLIVFGFTGLMGLVFSWYYSGYDRTPEEMAALIEDLMAPYFS
jgi:AcrR family transcriptional regulator